MSRTDRRFSGWAIGATIAMLTIKATVITLFVIASQASGDEPTGDAAGTSVLVRAGKPDEQARRTYLGRIVAEPMGHQGASWLVRPERETEENVDKAFQHLGIQADMVVCDLGCGNGYWTLPMARAVGEQGTVYAVDIQPQMLRLLRTRAGKAKVNNVVPVLGTVDDPKLPADAKVDMVLLVDVYHEFSHPESMLWCIRESLAPDGVISLLEYREEDVNVPIKPLHKMSKPQIMKEYTANGFKLVREFNDLPWQHLMFFARDDSPLESIEPVPFKPAAP